MKITVLDTSGKKAFTSFEERLGVKGISAYSKEELEDFA